MTAIKENSTIQQNKRIMQDKCPVTFTMEKIGGRWKPVILYHLQAGPLRYGQLKKSIPDITEKMLVQHLRELEADQLVYRDIKPVVPPHVEYSLTVTGKSLGPILNALASWGLNNRSSSVGVSASHRSV
jgi:DNA-binding HxlR family transcriptional regulator